MNHALSPYCRHLGPHASAADHWMLIGEYASPINRAPIVAIATLASTNAKTAGKSRIPTAGVYILAADTDPRIAVRTAADASICGDCPLTAGRGCYVRHDRGPLAAWRRYIAGEYRPFNPRAFTGIFTRLGEYGDPAFIPLRTLDAIVKHSAGHTGYTHAFGYRPREYSRHLMASVSTAAGAARAQSLGYRYFRVRPPDDAIAAREMQCPASAEAGHRLTCTQCGACNGAARGGRRVNVSIVAHGSRRRAAVINGGN